MCLIVDGGDSETESGEGGGHWPEVGFRGQLQRQMRCGKQKRDTSENLVLKVVAFYNQSGQML